MKPNRTTLSGVALTFLVGLWLSHASPAAADFAFHTTGTGWDGAGNNPTTLNYFVINTPASFPSAAAEITRALNLWSKYADNGSNDWFISLNDVSVGDTGFRDGFTIRYGTPGNWQTLGSGATGAIPDNGTQTSWVSDPVAIVPEPTTVALLGLGLVWFSWARLRRTRRRLKLVRVPAERNPHRVA